MINVKNLKKIIKVLKECKDPKQVEGNHYKNFLIEPWLFIKLNNLNSFQAQIIKYVVRYKNKNNPIADLNKIIDYCEKEKSFIQIESET
jgi:hypothetical protein